MSLLHIASAAEQVANHLREQLIHKVWVGTMPGGEGLARQLGVGRMTIEAALSLLESEGLLVPQGPRRRRKIMLPEDLAKPAGLRVGVLLYEQSDKTQDFHIDYKNKLEAAGHTVFYAASHLTEIKMDVRRLARMVKKTEADAWLVLGGTRGVLEWFIQQKTPAFADSGRRRGLKIAGIGPDHVPALTEATRRLIALGHQRIVLLDSLYKVSEPGIIGAAFLDVLSAGGIITSPYNMPGWEGGFEGLYAYLDASFQRTPPTAIIAGSSPIYFATQSFLVNRGIRVPQDLSLICVDNDPYFSECQPSVSHIRWSSQPIVNRIVRWVRNISEGKEDTHQTMIKAEFVERGTVGPVTARNSPPASGIDPGKFIPNV